MSGAPRPGAKFVIALALLALTPPTVEASEAMAASSPAPTSRTGAVIEYAGPPALASAASSWASACSFRHPLCVHAPSVATSSVLLAALSSADRAWDTLDGALALPLPDADLDGAWHVYLVDQVAGEGRALLEERDPRAHYDRGLSFAIVDRATPRGCALDLALARALTRAAILRAAPATDEASASAQTEALARLAVPCAQDSGDTLEFQSHPERAIADPRSGAFDRGASLFFDWLDATFAHELGGLIGGLWALAPSRTPPGAWRWANAATGYDVMRESLKGALSTDSTIDDVFVRFAVDRARATPSVRIAWHVPWPARARRLASPEPVFPTGASYLLVDHAGAPTGAKLRMEALWEDYGRMRWVVVKLDAGGRTMARLPVTSLDRGTRASLTVESLEGVDRLLIVGVNVGSTEHPFDPDQGEWEPHGWLVTLEGQE
jgi:hypothetical protein